jgi:hypothetical protein
MKEKDDMMPLLWINNFRYSFTSINSMLQEKLKLKTEKGFTVSALISTHQLLDFICISN